MTHTNELDDLVLDGWATINKCIMGFDVYNLVPEFETALIHNLPFKPDTKQEQQQPECNDSDNVDMSEEDDDYAPRACDFTTLNSYTRSSRRYLGMTASIPQVPTATSKWCECG
jgi:hypothetical protein